MRHQQRALFGVERLNALSDGMFAIVLTLLVLDLKLPEVAHPPPILNNLADNYNDFIGWTISFIAVARFWAVHHNIFARLARCHTGTIVLNFALLAAVSLVPFTASLLGTYPIHEPWSTSFFLINLAACSIALGVLAGHAAHEPQLLRADVEHTTLDWHRRHHLFVLPPVAAAAVPLAFLAPYLAITLISVEFAIVAARALR